MRAESMAAASMTTGAAPALRRGLFAGIALSGLTSTREALAKIASERPSVRASERPSVRASERMTASGSRAAGATSSPSVSPRSEPRPRSALKPGGLRAAALLVLLSLALFAGLLPGGAQAQTAPDAPAAPTASSLTPTGFTLSWTAPADNGTAITKYEWRLSVSIGGGEPLEVTSVETTATTAQYSGNNLSTNPIEYEAQVRAWNGTWSAWSATTQVTQPAGVVPDAPAAPTVGRTSGSEMTSLDVSWTAPANGGSLAI